MTTITATNNPKKVLEITEHDAILNGKIYDKNQAMNIINSWYALKMIDQDTWYSWIISLSPPS